LSYTGNRRRRKTGQEVDRSDINMRMGLADQAEILRKAFTLDELEAMDARIEAARNGETKQLPGPTGAPDVQPVLDQTDTQKPGCAATTVPESLGAGAAEDGVVPSVPKAPSSWRD